ncbi:hypothetical protein MYX82_00875 [Acidobacteria bacterium AH-259-D05]|nr:hypothetical protein [Acidobacteria bacterium AH-259-D05]
MCLKRFWNVGLSDKDLIERLASRNFLRIMRNDGVELDPDYQYPEKKYTRRPLTPPRRPSLPRPVAADELRTVI